MRFCDRVKKLEKLEGKFLLMWQGLVIQIQTKLERFCGSGARCYLLHSELDTKFSEVTKTAKHKKDKNNERGS